MTMPHRAAVLALAMLGLAAYANAACAEPGARTRRGGTTSPLHAGATLPDVLNSPRTQLAPPQAPSLSASSPHQPALRATPSPSA